MRQKLPIFYSAMVLTGVNLLLRGVSTSFQVFISRRIGAAGVGLLQLVLSIGSLALTAGMGGIRTATMYLTAESLGKHRRGDLPRVLGCCTVYSLLFSGAVAAILYAAAPFLCRVWIGEPQVCSALRSYALFLPVVCLSGCFTGYFTAANRIGTLAAVEVGEQLCYMAVTLILLTFWAGDDSAKACQAVVLGHGISALSCLICLYFLYCRESIPAASPIPVARKLLETALPLALADDLKAGISTTENLMVPRRLSRYAGEDAPLAAFGTVYGMVFPVLMFPASILFSLAELLIPELARCHAADSRNRITYLVRRSLKVGILYGCVMGGILYLTAQALCAWLYPGTQAGAWLRLYAFLVPMLYTDTITDAMTKGLGQQRYCVRYNILTSALDVLFLFFVLPIGGMQGYFLSFLVTHGINFLLSLRRLGKLVPLSFPLSRPMTALVSAWVCALVCDTLPHPAAKVVSFLALYLSLLVLLGVLSMADLRWVKGLARQQ